MADFISRREVFNNLMRFKHSLGGHISGDIHGKRSYKALFNRQTGDIQFPEAQAPSSAMGEWDLIEFEVNPERLGTNFFEAKDKDHHPLNSGNMAPVAWRIMIETIQALNEITAHSPSKNLPEKAVVEGLSKLKIPSFRAIEMQPGWVGQVDRFQAEKDLSSKPIGTYLLRNGDEVTEEIAKRLMESNKMGVEVFVCTLVEPEDKISDILILLTDKGWTFYHDNPDLFDSEYKYQSEPEKLLKQLGKRVKFTV